LISQKSKTNPLSVVFIGIFMNVVVEVVVLRIETIVVELEDVEIVEVNAGAIGSIVGFPSESNFIKLQKLNILILVRVLDNLNKIIKPMIS
jgi:hypothetical protein